MDFLQLNRPRPICSLTLRAASKRKRPVPATEQAFFAWAHRWGAGVTTSTSLSTARARRDTADEANRRHRTNLSIGGPRQANARRGTTNVRRRTASWPTFAIQALRQAAPYRPPLAPPRIPGDRRQSPNLNGWHYTSDTAVARALRSSAGQKNRPISAAAIDHVKFNYPDSQSAQEAKDPKQGLGLKTEKQQHHSPDISNHHLDRNHVYFSRFLPYELPDPDRLEADAPGRQ